MDTTYHPTSESRVLVVPGCSKHSHFFLTARQLLVGQTSMPLTGFEPAIPARERPQIHVLDGVAPGIGPKHLHSYCTSITKF